MVVDIKQWMQEQGAGVLSAAGFGGAGGSGPYDIFSGGVASPGGVSNPRVYWGASTTPVYDPARDALTRGTSKKQELYMGLDQALSDIYTWSDEERSAFGKRLYSAGLINDPANYDQINQMWSAAVTESAKYSAVGKKMTPWGVIGLMEGLAGGGPKSKTTTNKSTSYDIASKEDVAGMVTSVFKNALGRAPTDGEMDRYSSMLIRKSKTNPRVTSTTQTTDVNGNSTSSSTSSGGYSSQAAEYDAQKKAQGDPEYGAYQAATTYFNALVGALGSPG